MTKYLQFLAFASVLAFTSCGKKDSPTPATPVVPEPETAKAMFMNTCLSTEGVIVKLNNATLPDSRGLGYLANTGYVNVTPANGVKTSFVLQSSDIALAETTQDYKVNMYYSVFATGVVTNPSIFITSDDLSTPAGNVAKVRFINLSLDNLNENVFLEKMQIGTGVKYKEATGFTEVTAGTYKVTVQDQDPNKAPLTIILSGQQFAAGKIYTILLTGTENGNGDAALKLSMVNNN